MNGGRLGQRLQVTEGEWGTEWRAEGAPEGQEEGGKDCQQKERQKGQLLGAAPTNEPGTCGRGGLRGPGRPHLKHRRIMPYLRPTGH